MSNALLIACGYPGRCAACSIASLPTDFSGLPNEDAPDRSNRGDDAAARPRGLPDAFAEPADLFLYQIELNAAWCNMDILCRVRPGENGFPSLGLELFPT